MNMMSVVSIHMMEHGTLSRVAQIHHLVDVDSGNLEIHDTSRSPHITMCWRGDASSLVLHTRTAHWAHAPQYHGVVAIVLPMQGSCPRCKEESTSRCWWSSAS